VKLVLSNSIRKLEFEPFQKTVLVMIRLKNDKQIGANMTIKNTKFKKALDKNLNSILSDLNSGNFEEHEL